MDEFNISADFINKNKSQFTKCYTLKIENNKKGFRSLIKL